MGTQKIALMLIGVLALATLLGVGIYRADTQASYKSKAQSAAEPEIAQEYIANNLSDDAEYPTPVIQLQQLLTSELVKQQSEISSNDILDNDDAQSDENNKADEITALRQRLNKLQTINNN